MRTLDRSVWYKAIAVVAVFVTTGGWIWLLYVLTKWIVLALHPHNLFVRFRLPIDPTLRGRMAAHPASHHVPVRVQSRFKVSAT
jgi:hypothetical protein